MPPIKPTLNKDEKIPEADSATEFWDKKEQVAAAMEVAPLLLNKDIFSYITKGELDKLIVGELESRQTIFLCAMGMFVQNATISSYNLLVNDIAGAGKDYITSKTLGLLPDFRLNKRTRISPTVFTYWHNSKFEPDWSWDGTVLYLEDVSNSVLNSSVFKVMCSSGSNTTVVKDQRAIDIKIIGKPVMIITSATAAPNPELTRRFTILNLDAGIDQTKAIVDKHLEFAETGINPIIDNDVTKALENLQRIKVKIPFAKKIKDFVPMESVIMRTHILRFMDYIKASCALHQFQRKRDEDNYFIATEQDYQIARIAIKKTTSNQFMIPLTKDQRRILEIMKETAHEWFEVSDLEVKINWMSDKWLREQLDRLVEYGLLVKDSRQTESSKRKVMVYMFDINNIIDLPETLNQAKKIEIKPESPVETEVIV